MCFEHNLNYVHNSSHLTRWVAPTPQYTSGIMLTPPIKLVWLKLGKSQNATGTFHFHPSSRHPNRHTDAQTCMTVAPDTLQLSANFHPESPTQSKATHILSNFGSHPFTKLKMHPLPQLHWLPQSHPSHTGV